MSGPEGAAPTADEQQELVQRILASGLFSKSHRLSAFLRYIVDQSARGETSAINEQRIGTEVFGRPRGYHAGEDSIVRSQARFLRLRLEEYFSTVGAAETITLSVPKGSYVPLFVRRAVGLEPEVAPPASALQPPSPPFASIPRRNAHEKEIWLYRSFCALAILVATLLTAVAFRTGHALGGAGQSPIVKAFWVSLFNTERTTLIVPGDSTLVLMEELTGTSVDLQSYINRDYLAQPPGGSITLWNMLLGSQYTSTADLTLVARLQQIPEVVHTRPAIRYARDLSLNDLQESNAILIGGLRANPWAQLFLRTTGFRVDYDVSSHRNLVRNQRPGNGELPEYVESASADSAAHAFGVVTYLPSLDRQGHSLLVEGTSKAGTQAAAEFLTSPKFDQFLLRIGFTPRTLPSFEVLISAQVLDGTSYRPSVVCWHVWPVKTSR